VGLFTPSKAFDVVVAARIKALLPPSLKIVDLTAEELLNTVREWLEKVRTPSLSPDVLSWHGL